MAALRRTLAIWGRVANGIAWLFAAGSLGALLLVAWYHTSDTNAVSHILAVKGPEGGSLTIPGFRYVGVPGAVLLWFEIALVTAALIGTVLPWPRPRHLGHLVLSTWAAWWVAAAVHMRYWEEGIGWTLLAPILAVPLACTLIRAIRGWRGRTVQVTVPRVPVA